MRDNVHGGAQQRLVVGGVDAERDVLANVLAVERIHLHLYGLESGSRNTQPIPSGFELRKAVLASRVRHGAAFEQRPGFGEKDGRPWHGQPRLVTNDAADAATLGLGNRGQSGHKHNCTSKKEAIHAP